MADKGIKSEEINIHLKVKPDWYLEKVNSSGKVPTIEHNGHYIPESLIAFGKHYCGFKVFQFHCLSLSLAYIDEVFGEESVWPKDPYLRAKARLFVNDFDNKVRSMQCANSMNADYSVVDTLSFHSNVNILVGSSNKIHTVYILSLYFIKKKVLL